ncbi:MAG: transporter substrate-binding domain-containing protein [Gammaproteobacteria bacterium]|nr:transporter substrate-binding domain-containing protein [Gammaproteobacteria bacterium]
MDWDRRGFLEAVALAACLPRLALAGEAAPLRMVYFDTYPPFSYNEAGQWRGILVDLVREALEGGLGLKVEHLGYPWRRAQIMVQGGQADGFLTVPTPERRIYAEFSAAPLYQARAAIAYSKRSRLAERLDKVRILADLLEVPHGNYFGNGWAAQNLKAYDVEWSPTLEIVLRKLVQQRREVCVDNFPSLYHAVHSTKLRRELVVKPLPDMGFPFPMHIGLRRRLPGIEELITRLDAWNAGQDAKARAQRLHDRYLPDLAPELAKLLY